MTPDLAYLLYLDASQWIYTAFQWLLLSFIFYPAFCIDLVQENVAFYWWIRIWLRSWQKFQLWDYLFSRHLVLGRSDGSIYLESIDQLFPFYSFLDCLEGCMWLDSDFSNIFADCEALFPSWVSTIILPWGCFGESCLRGWLISARGRW